MSETERLILGICILIVVYVLTRKFHAWRMRQTYILIIKDLEQKGAVDPSSAIELPYAKKGIFRIGMRDYRPKAIEYMLISNIIGMTDSGKYYLKDKRVGSLNAD
ncbi:MAG: hypothetical protein JSV50_06085 [Desulfobacteraceae bacterium]|nr:MAG: hypothetical protein JSV50_06085 [Desulfobacteraceae bacterium]